MGTIRDLSGQVFSRLTAVKMIGLRNNRAMWHCRCECGGTAVVQASSLLNGHTRSCGCIGHARHGHSWQDGKLSPTYASWKSMIARCTQPSSPAYAYYRAQGVTLCYRWRTFENFLADMGERPSLRHSIDRFPNQRGNYEPGNCRWATKQEQANNRVTNKLFVYQGEEITFAELVRRTGMPKELLRHRLLRAGWPLEKALSLPLSQGRRRAGLGF